MSFEVEMKFRIENTDGFLNVCTAHGMIFGPPVEERDVFYQHPSRDFAVTDEGLRIRHRAGEYFITYKGPKIDSLTKTRQEIELPLHCDEENYTKWENLLLSLGFIHAGIVTKIRRTAHFDFRNRSFEITLDTLPVQGSFAELETIAEEASLDAAKTSLWELAATLHLEENIRISYLEMVLGSKM
ncbi:MAG: class IV adenylate cyclase [Planctomycetaceae bacterium]|jgi:adenylate cyclase class 2|nr:class IV adenylate cyclase [Planctomycetaceae bacterium]